MMAAIILVLPSGPGHARLEAMDRASLLHVPAVRARQGAADHWPWPGSRSTAAAASGDRQRTARILLLGFVPALIVFMQPDLGTAIVYIVITLAILFVVGVRWTHFALLGGAAGGRRISGAGDRPGDRAPGLARLPAGAADVVPESQLGPARRDLSDRSVADRDRVRRQDRARSRLDTDRARLRARTAPPTSSSPSSASDSASSALPSSYPFTPC